MLVEESEEPPEKRRRIERDLNWLPNYDLNRELDGSVKRESGIVIFARHAK